MLFITLREYQMSSMKTIVNLFMQSWKTLLTKSMNTVKELINLNDITTN